jgi:hypothetical protein
MAAGDGNHGSMILHGPPASWPVEVSLDRMRDQPLGQRLSGGLRGWDAVFALRRPDGTHVDG